MLRSLTITAIAWAALASNLPPQGRASLYSPDDFSLTLPARPDGTGEPLPFDEFKRRLIVAGNIGNPGLKTEDRKKIETRATDRMKRRDLSQDETLALAVDLLRLGTAAEAPAGGGFGAPRVAPAANGRLDADEALNRLMRLKRERPNYYVFSTLAHLYAARGDWSDAVTHLESAIYDYAPPPPEPGLTPEQQRWQLRLDREYVLPFFRHQQYEASFKPRPPADSEDVYPLFPLREKGKAHEPVRFVNEAGQYEPGQLAAKEKAKLPADAVAVVQQLLLWFPRDTRLFWLLGELYAAEGNLEDAKRAFDYCVSEAGLYGNRKLLVEHRTAVRAAVDATATKPIEDYPVSWQMIVGYFAIVVIVVAFAAYRSIRRGSARGSCGPSGCG